MTSSDPKPVSELDDQLRSVIKRATFVQRVSIYGIAIVVIGLLGGFGYLLDQNFNDQQRISNTVDAAISSDCGFFYEVGTLTLVTSGPHQSSKLAIQLVVNGRNTFIGQHCSGSLGPAQPGLRRLAQQYHVTLKG